MLVSTLEDKLGIKSVHGAPVNEKDVLTYYSTRTEELEMKVDAMEQNQQAMQQMKQEIDELKQAFRELKCGKAALTESVGEPLSMAPTLIAINNPLFDKQLAAPSLSASGTAAASEVELVELGALPPAPPLALRPPPPPSRAVSLSLAVAAATISEPTIAAASAIAQQSAFVALVEPPVVASAVRARPAPISRRMQSIIVTDGSSSRSGGATASASGASGSEGSGAAAAATPAPSAARAHVREW